MGESACLMHSFSYASSAIPIPTPTEPNDQGNHVHGLGDSISFGRFMSESLAWEKWSTFSHKRYVEEAQSYAQPGSVAQKKAFFEAHYKRIAAQKAAAAALLEQEKAAATNTTSSESQVEAGVSGINPNGSHVSGMMELPNSGYLPTRLSNSHGSPTDVFKSHDLQTIELNTQMVVHEEQQNMTQDADNVVDDGGHCSAVNPVELEIDKILGAPNPKNTESLSNLEKFEDQPSVSEDSRTSQMEKPLLKSKLNTDQEVSQPTIKKKPAIPSWRSPKCRKPSRIPPSPAKSVAPLGPRKEKLMKQTRIPPSPTKPVASVHPRKENTITPRTKGPTTMNSIDERRATPKSLYTLMNSNSVREHCKLTSMAVRKIESTRPASSSHTMPKFCATPLRTPSKASTNGLNKQSLSTPSSENKRMETPLHPLAAGSKTAGPKWHILSAVSKSLSTYRSKLQSPTISSPFILRTEERAARRKQKLEEKFNEKEAQKVQPQTSLKEKAETEFRRLLCFKARPLPDFYKERETSNNQIKKKLQHENGINTITSKETTITSPSLLQTPQPNPKSVTPGRKPPSVISRPSSTNKSSRRLWKQNDQYPTHYPLSSLTEMMSHENISPNVQL